MNSLKFRPVLAAVAAATGVFIAACDGSAATVEPLPATATLAPIISLTPRFTATPIPTRTEMPTETLTPSQTFTEAPPTETFTPSPTPPITGSVYSVNDVNLREGPGVTFPLITALRPGTSVEVVATDTSGAWYNVRMEDGDEGWISATLVRLEPTNTPLPSATPSPDLTSLALGRRCRPQFLAG
ncbi:MAG: NLP/P60 protein, partial [Chloroflexi bacterium OLB15]